jgi:hypothetical protein
MTYSYFVLQMSLSHHFMIGLSQELGHITLKSEVEKLAQALMECVA